MVRDLEDSPAEEASRRSQHLQEGTWSHQGSHGKSLVTTPQFDRAHLSNTTTAQSIITNHLSLRGHYCRYSTVSWLYQIAWRYQSARRYQTRRVFEEMLSRGTYNEINVHRRDYWRPYENKRLRGMPANINSVEIVFQSITYITSCWI